MAAATTAGRNGAASTARRSRTRSINDVVIAAANEAGGQGFVTEYAQPAATLQNRVWFEFEESEWTAFSTQAANLGADQLFSSL